MKKLILLAMAAAAVAASAMPAAASALTLQDAGGKIAVGTTIVGTSVDTTVTNTPVGTLMCPHIEASAVVRTNNGALVTANSGAVSPPLNCLADGQNLTITNPTLLHIETVGNDLGSLSLHFEADVGPFECLYGGTVAFTYGTGASNNTLTLLGTLSSPFEFCEPEEPPIIFEGHYKMLTTNGAAVWIVSGP